MVDFRYLLGGYRWHLELEELGYLIVGETRKHPSYESCDCPLSTTVRERMANSPLEHLTKEEFQELFNNKKLATDQMLRDDFEGTVKYIAERRTKMLRFIAKFQTSIHAMEESTREYERTANAIEKKKLAEASKRYTERKTVEAKAEQRKTGNELLDRLVEKLGSLEAAEEFLKNLKG